MLTAARATADRAPAVDRSGDRQFATTLANGMALLSSFRGGERMLANRDFVARTGLAKANVSRLAFTLVQLGFLRHDPTSGKYLLGSPVLSMGYPLLARMHIRQIARPYMREMAEELGAAVSMGVRDRSHMIYVETSRSAAFGAGAVDIGTVLPLLASAMGSAWLAAVPIAERKRAVNQAIVAAGRPAGERHRAEGIARGVREWATSGYCTWRDDVRAPVAVAVPIRSPIDAEIVVFDCTLRSPRRAAAAVDAAGRRLIVMVRSIEEAMSVR